ncbi:actin-associated protein FAM107A isoform X2 [Scleropages formosus]|uniref:Actin-associated protein FAM107A n=1 Tax=Scleropages formosus TaxID=113540 RepID=A0A8C9T4A3_SCLFO|nr:actin-associated protein FAM107A isoform X2 [Scleropages formosus]XP_018589680.1 actin-associated protein FAM107A isoform X2 [Scleropages formosus]
MGASHGKKRYSVERPCMKNGNHLNGTASAYADLRQDPPRDLRQDPYRSPHGNRHQDWDPHQDQHLHQQQQQQQYQYREPPLTAGFVPHPDYMEGDDDLIKPKKLLNPVKASKSHQDLHRELLMNHRRGQGVESKSELQRVLDHRKREQMMKQRKAEEEARRKISPLEQELLKRHKKLEEMEKEQEKQEEEKGGAPEFIKVKENLRRTSILSTGEKEA